MQKNPLNLKAPIACKGGAVLPLEHFTVVIESQIVRENELNKGDLGLAVFTVKCWAETKEDAEEMAVFFLQEHAGGFVKGRIDVFASEPDEPAEDEPYGYGIDLMRFDATAHDQRRVS